MIEERKFAVLIDAENISHEYIKEILEEIAKLATPTIKRAYADWTKSNVSPKWKDSLLDNAITPIQQYSYTNGKNSTDSALIIDAMDVLYSGKVNGFCIVSSDSDFTRLVIRLREAGMIVVGIGEKKTPKALIAACDKFTYIEILREEAHPEDNSKPNNTPAPPAPKVKIEKETFKLLIASANDAADEDGWAFLADLGSLIRKKKPDFDPRNYGFQKLLPLIKSLNRFEIDERSTDKKNVKHIFIRLKG